jgi:acyl carrier protein
MRTHATAAHGASPSSHRHRRMQSAPMHDSTKAAAICAVNGAARSASQCQRAASDNRSIATDIAARPRTRLEAWRRTEGGGMMTRLMRSDTKPDRPEILAELKNFIAGWFRDGRDDGLEPHTPLVTSGIVDSAGIFEVVEFIEERFGVGIGDADISLQTCNTLAGLTDLVVSKL